MFSCIPAFLHSALPAYSAPIIMLRALRMAVDHVRFTFFFTMTIFV